MLGGRARRRCGDGDPAVRLRSAPVEVGERVPRLRSEEEPRDRTGVSACRGGWEVPAVRRCAEAERLARGVPLAPVPHAPARRRDLRLADPLLYGRLRRNQQGGAVMDNKQALRAWTEVA